MSWGQHPCLCTSILFIVQYHDPWWGFIMHIIYQSLQARNTFNPVMPCSQWHHQLRRGYINEWFPQHAWNDVSCCTATVRTCILLNSFATIRLKQLNPQDVLCCIICYRPQSRRAESSILHHTLQKLQLMGEADISYKNISNSIGGCG